MAGLDPTIIAPLGYGAYQLYLRAKKGASKAVAAIKTQAEQLENEQIKKNLPKRASQIAPFVRAHVVPERKQIADETDSLPTAWKYFKEVVVAYGEKFSTPHDVRTYLQGEIDSAKKQGRHLVVMLGDNHLSCKQYQFAVELVKDLEGVDAVFTETFSNDPTARPDKPAIENALTQTDLLPKLPALNNWKERLAGYPEIEKSQAGVNVGLYSFLQGDNDALIDFYLGGNCDSGSCSSVNRRNARNFLEYLATKNMPFNPQCSKDRVNLLDAAKRNNPSAEAHGLAFTSAQMQTMANMPEEENPYQPTREESIRYLTTGTSLADEYKEAYFSAGINDFFLRSGPEKAKTAFVVLGEKHIRKSGLPEYILAEAKGKPIKIITIAMEGAHEEPSDQLEKNLVRLKAKESFFGIRFGEPTNGFQEVDMLLSF